ncbi:MAG: glycosyltransferase family 2 protein [Desulfosporosinus sp.]|nr:glycosyltransferase family 2 protein [Desulfosporosinus sp.]
MQNCNPRIAIILLNYCNYQDTLQCVDSLKKINYDNYYVLIVDNASDNQSMSVLQKIENDRITVVSSGKNGGFAYGNNYAIDIASKRGYDFVLLLNNDTLVDADFLNKLVAANVDVACDMKVGMLTSRIMFYPDTEKVWYAGGKVDWNNLRAIQEGYNYEHSDHHSKNKTVTFASGCCMLISKEVIKNVGKLPEDYFMYYEDLDYCVQVTDAGYGILYVTDSIMYHCVSSSSGGQESPFVVEWTARSRRKFFRKYKHKMSPVKGKIVCLKCECRALIKILLGKNRIKKINAYIWSFTG